jgi:alanine racemase
MTGRLRIDLGALTANYALFRTAARPGRAAAVVKADGYGIGAPAVARALWSAGCRDFFVASAAEGARLREGLPDATIFVFEGALEDTASILVHHRLRPVLNHRAQLETWRRHGGGGVAAVHVDTGMHRLGFTPDVAAAEFHGVPICLLITHLACADEPDHPLNALQMERLRQVRRRFPGVPVSVGNSAGVLAGRRLAGAGEPIEDLGRPGIGLYGGNPFAHGPSPVRPVVTLEGRILQLRSVAPGESVGYGAAFTATHPMAVAIVGVGYADGLPRLLSDRGEAALDGRRCRIVGRVSMDLTTIDVTGATARIGDWVELFGNNVLVDEVAAWAQTVPYEILTRLGPRLAREYLEP